MQGNEETPPVIVESNPTIIVETPPEPIIEPDYSEDAIRELDEWCASIEARLAALETASLGFAPGEHSHDGYAVTEHEHAITEHEHGEQYAAREHEHAAPRENKPDEAPKPTHPWFRPVFSD